MIKQAFEILNIIAENGGEAKIVGGAVRDFLLDREIKDVDIATTLKPLEIINIFERLNCRVIPTGIDFGTVTLLYKENPYEITTLRSDINPDGRHTKVAYTTDWQIDAMRRDFTFNALYMDYNQNIDDFFNGKNDLEKGIVRFIGDSKERISEDYLRILRMFRFHCYCGKGEIFKSQLQAVEDLKGGLGKISAERIYSELMKILSHPKRFSALIPMQKHGIITQIFGEEIILDCERENKDIHQHTKNPLVVLYSIIENPTDEKINHIIEKLKFSKREKAVLKNLKNYEKVNYNSDLEVKKAIGKYGKETFQNFISLALIKNIINESKYKELMKFLDEFEVPKFPLSGVDLKNQGYQEGREIGQKLEEARKLWENSNYNFSKNELISKLSN